MTIAIRILALLTLTVPARAQTAPVLRPAQAVDLPAHTLVPADPAKDVAIMRDTWGIAHVHGHSDAQAVFGMVYAQAEDGFNRIEK